MELSTNKKFQELKAKMIKHFIELPGDHDIEAFGFKGWETDDPPARTRKQIENMSDERAFKIMLELLESEF